MQADDKDDAAKSELREFKIRWENTIQFLKGARVSPKQFRAYHSEFSDESKEYIRYYWYRCNVNEEIIKGARETFSIIGNDLSLALSKGRQNYDDEKRKRWIENILILIKILSLPVIAILAILIAKFVFNIRIPLL